MVLQKSYRRVSLIEGMGERTQINFVVDEKQKARWETAVNEHPEAENLSHLIRISVSREIAGGDRVSNDAAVSSEAVGELQETLYTEVADPLRSLQQDVNSISRQINALDREEKASGENYDLQKVLFEMLPTPPEDPDPDSPKPHNINPPEFALSADEIADRVGADTDEVHDALKQLDEVTSVVRSGLNNSGEFWFKTSDPND